MIFDIFFGVIRKLFYFYFHHIIKIQVKSPVDQNVCDTNVSGYKCETINMMENVIIKRFT